MRTEIEHSFGRLEHTFLAHIICRCRQRRRRIDAVSALTLNTQTDKILSIIPIHALYERQQQF